MIDVSLIYITYLDQVYAKKPSMDGNVIHACTLSKREINKPDSLN
jgi:hypothetical protein